MSSDPGDEAEQNVSSSNNETSTQTSWRDIPRGIRALYNFFPRPIIHYLLAVAGVSLGLEVVALLGYFVGAAMGSANMDSYKGLFYMIRVFEVALLASSLRPVHASLDRGSRFDNIRAVFGEAADGFENLSFTTLILVFGVLTVFVEESYGILHAVVGLLFWPACLMSIENETTLGGSLQQAASLVGQHFGVFAVWTVALVLGLTPIKYLISFGLFGVVPDNVFGFIGALSIFQTFGLLELLAMFVVFSTCVIAVERRLPSEK